MSAKAKTRTKKQQAAAKEAELLKVFRHAILEADATFKALPWATEPDGDKVSQDPRVLRMAHEVAFKCVEKAIADTYERTFKVAAADWASFAGYSVPRKRSGEFDIPDTKAQIKPTPLPQFAN